MHSEYNYRPESSLGFPIPGCDLWRRVVGAKEQNDSQPNNENTTSGYLEGWALKSLVLALMNSGFMLSLDDTSWVWIRFRVCIIAMSI